jgi:hypothetical protein
MILPQQMDRIPEAVGRWLAKRRAWDPAGQRVVLRIDETGDPELFGAELRGVIRASAPGEGGSPARALIELDREADYSGHYTRRGIKRVITTPYLRWHGLSRLLVTSAAVRVIDADDFGDESYDRIIALASMSIDPRPCS